MKRLIFLTLAISALLLSSCGKVGTTEITSATKITVTFQVKFPGQGEKAIPNVHFDVKTEDLGYSSTKNFSFVADASGKYTESFGCSGEKGLKITAKASIQKDGVYYLGETTREVRGGETATITVYLHDNY